MLTLLFDSILEPPNLPFSPTLFLASLWIGSTPPIVILLLTATSVFIITVVLTFKAHRWRPSQLCIICRTTFLNERIVERIKNNVGEYIPPWWYNRHLGAIVPFGCDAKLKYERELFSVEDACFAVDWYPCNPQHIHRTSPGPVKICVFYPGLGLGSANKFAQQFVSYLAKYGYYCAIITSRGVDIPLKSSSVWHPGLYDDSKLALRYIDRNIPGSHIFLVGFSAGTNIVQKTLLDKTLGVNIVAAMCVCVSSDYIAARDNLEDTFQGRVYSRLMATIYKDVLAKNSHVHEEIGTDIVQRLLACPYLSDFDHIACTAVYGYKSEEEYALAISSLAMDDMPVPFLALQPRDDPLHQHCIRSFLQVEEYTRNPKVIYVEPQFGNHFGFYEGSILEAFSNKTSYTYPAKVAKEFFDVILEDLSSSSSSSSHNHSNSHSNKQSNSPSAVAGSLSSPSLSSPISRNGAKVFGVRRKGRIASNC